jgi:hypothetical protein
MICCSARASIVAAAALLALTCGSVTASHATFINPSISPEARAELSGAATRDIVVETRLS